MPNLSATATLRICVTPDSKHVKETHLDQTALVSARGTNRNTIQPLGQLEESCQDTTKRSHNRRQSLHMECTLGQTRHTKSCWLRKGEPNEAFQLPAGYLKWLGVEAQWHFSDTLSILAQRHMPGPGVIGCWTSQTMQNAAVCFEEGHQKPLLQSTCWRVLFQVCKSNVKIRLLKRDEERMLLVGAMECALRACCMGEQAKLQALIMWPWQSSIDINRSLPHTVMLDIGQPLGARGNTQQWLLKHERSGTRHQIKDIWSWILRSPRLTTNATIWCSMTRKQCVNWCSGRPHGHAVEHSKTGHCNV